VLQYLAILCVETAILLLTSLAAVLSLPWFVPTEY